MEWESGVEGVKRNFFAIGCNFEIFSYIRFRMIQDGCISSAKLACCYMKNWNLIQGFPLSRVADISSISPMLFPVFMASFATAPISSFPKTDI
jgi:hypothetical protein